MAHRDMARRAHDLRRALDVNANGTRMRNRAIVYAHVYVRARAWRRIADVPGAAAGMQRFGCGWHYGAGACCGVRCMCTGPIAIQVDVTIYSL